MSNPLVTIGLPVYNGADYVAESIESILNQTHRELELVVCDNASTDDTYEICRSYAGADDRVRLEQNATNMGAAFNYNRTVDLARGSYFKWQAHDDVCRPRFIEACVAAMEADPGISLAYPTPIDIDGDGNELGERDTGLGLDGSRPSTRFMDTMRKAHACLPVFGLMRTEILRQTCMHGNYPAADRVLISELALHGRLYEVPEPLFLHREHEGRFVYTHRDLESQARWFDPAQTSGARYPLLIRFRECLAAIRRAPVSPAEKARSYGFMARWLVDLGPDVAKEVSSGLVRSRPGGLVES